MPKITVDAIYTKFRSNITDKKFNAIKLAFTGVEDKDVYNITAPFLSHGKKVIAGRVEGRDTEYSHVMFFEEKKGKWSPVDEAPVLALQDPCVARINNEIIIGGVEVFDHPTLEGCLWWRTVFFRGKDILSLQRFAVGPNGMKDIRLVERQNKKVGVFTRPQHPEGIVGSLGGRGKIGYVEVESLDEINPENLLKAQILDQISDENWLGANEIHILENGKLGVLAHVASYDANKDRHYYPAAFIFDPKTIAATEINIIVERKMFLDGPSKKPDLNDVVFSGGLVRKGYGMAELYVGTSDAEAQMIEIPDPFIL